MKRKEITMTSIKFPKTFNRAASFLLILPWDGGTGRAAQGSGISQASDRIGRLPRSDPASGHAGGAFPAGSTGQARALRGRL